MSLFIVTRIIINNLCVNKQCHIFPGFRQQTCRLENGLSTSTDVTGQNLQFGAISAEISAGNLAGAVDCANFILRAIIIEGSSNASWLELITVASDQSISIIFHYPLVHNGEGL